MNREYQMNRNKKWIIQNMESLGGGRCETR